MADLAPEVRALITEHISSVAQLEALLLLRHADRWWTAAALSMELRADRGWLTGVLTDLCARGFCEQYSDAIPQFRFQPRTSELEKTITALAQDYLVYRMRVTELIYSKPSDAIRAFAQAFDLRKGGRHV